MYDYIIAGMGCAGLSLAYRLNRSTLKDKKILLIDKEEKTKNDRTWSFWVNQPMLFDHLAFHQWNHLWFHTPDFSKHIDIAPYRYQMIRGIDFYQSILQELSQNPNIEFLFGEIEQITEISTQACVRVNQQIYTAPWVFNSLSPHNPTPRKGYHYLKQHFKGWVIQTPSPCFDPATATFMDFRIAQKKEVRFAYILPFSRQKALVEFTVFSRDVLNMQEYNQELKNYLRDFLKLENYEIIEEEFGVIPMEDASPSAQSGKRILPIGIAGGQAKPSSGYAFLNIQKQCDAILDSLLTRSSPFYAPRSIYAQRFRLYDSMLLNIMAKNRYSSRDIFRILFQKHPIQRIFRFLDEESHFGEEFAIMLKMPPAPFLKALKEVVFR